MITESNEDIRWIVNEFNKKVIRLRRKYPNTGLLPKLKEFNDEVILPWVENFYLDSVEVDREYDEELKNRILDRSNWIDRILGENI